MQNTQAVKNCRCRSPDGWSFSQRYVFR